MSVRPSVLALVALSLIVAAGTAALVVTGEPQRRAVAAGLRADALPPGLDGAPAPRIRLPDARGGTLDTRALDGRPYLVTFVYAGCRDVCPAIGLDIADALRRLGTRASSVAVLAVSVDPRGDTPAVARRWLARYGLGTRAHYLVGARGELTPVWRAWYLLGGDQARLDPATHAAAVWLVDARGRLRGRWPAGRALDPADIAHDLAALLEQA